MKKIFVIILTLSLIYSCHQDKEIYLSKDFKTTFDLALKNNKNILLDFYTTWCGSCKGYDKYIFNDSVFRSYLTKDFYSLKLDAELTENKVVVDKYKIGAYPTIIIANSEGNEINRIVGFSDDKPEYYIELIENILKGQENFYFYKKEYLSYPDSLELATEIIMKLFKSEDYKNVDNFIEIIKSNSKNSELLWQSDLFSGFSKLYNRQSPNPTYLKNLLETSQKLDDYWKENILTGLISYYEQTNVDSFEFYSYHLEADYPYSFYWNRKFALYLFENSKDIETADRITTNYALKNKNDHWTPFLQGHSLASKGKKEQAFNNFDKWLIKYSDSEENKNRYYKYIDLSVFYEYRLDKAIEYAIKIEKDVSNIPNRKILAKLYYLINQNDKAVTILKETIPMIESAKEKELIDKLIKEYAI
jgi:thiol-disulfide isomerase/thioredoxin